MKRRTFVLVGAIVCGSRVNTPSVIPSNETNGSRYLSYNNDLNLWMATELTIYLLK
jgi:hypothetical protein